MEIYQSDRAICLASVRREVENAWFMCAEMECDCLVRCLIKMIEFIFLIRYCGVILVKRDGFLAA